VNARSDQALSGEPKSDLAIVNFDVRAEVNERFRLSVRTVPKARLIQIGIRCGTVSRIAGSHQMDSLGCKYMVEKLYLQSEISGSPAFAIHLVEQGWSFLAALETINLPLFQSVVKFWPPWVSH
jgi:hypothetical protein